MASNPNSITRYPNRRFYARNESRYVSLKEIEEMVCGGQNVEIRDSQTDEDLTRSVLTRIILEHQPEKMGLFPADMLHFMLRSNQVMSDFLRDYFLHALPYLEYLQRHSSTTAIHLMQPVHWVKAWLDRITPLKASNGERAPAEDAASLAKRVAELEARIRQLEAPLGVPDDDRARPDNS